MTNLPLYIVGLPCYQSQQILSLTSTFQKLDFMREGGFASIYVGEIRHTQVAIKFVKKVYIKLYISYILL